MDLLGWIVALGCVALVLGWERTIRDVWRERRPDPRFADPPATWGHSAALWRAGYRVIPVAGPAFLVVLPLVVLDRTGADGPFANAVSLVFSSLAAVVFVLLVSVALFNAPKRLVAPHLRSQPGVLREWFGRERR